MLLSKGIIWYNFLNKGDNFLKDKNERLKLGWALQLDFMRDVYKEIRHIRDYDKKSLFSDVSAIIGFICGFSIS